MEMMDEWAGDVFQNHTNHSPWAIFRNDYRDFESYLANLEITEETPEGRVPGTTLFLLDDERDRLMGAANVHHYLNEGLLATGDHIGDGGIRPSDRRHGYGTRLVTLALKECRRLGIDRVLMCCDKDNVGSAKTIARNGGRPRERGAGRGWHPRPALLDRRQQRNRLSGVFCRIGAGAEGKVIVQRCKTNSGRGPDVHAMREDFNMKATVNEDCIGCGLCESTCPEVFVIGDDGVAEVTVEEVPEEAEDGTQEAADNCPVSAIEVE